jgi:dynein heavy chain 1
LTGDKTATLALAKRSEAALEASRSVSAQVQVVNFGEGSPFETLHSLVRQTLMTYFKSLMSQNSGGASADDKKASEAGLGLVSVNQKLAELELSLYNCKQSVQIPRVTLAFATEILKSAQQVWRDSQRLCRLADANTSFTGICLG